MTAETETAARFLIAAGTARYDDDSLRDLDVARDLDRVTEIFEQRGYKRILADLSLNPTAAQLRSAMEEWLVSDQLKDDDILVIYYAGHGVKAKGGHYLMCADSHHDRLVSTALRAQDLVLMVAEAPKNCHVLIVLDTCYAGAGAGDMAALAGQLTAVRPPAARGLWLLAAARAKDEAIDNAFVDGLSEALRHARAGAHQAFIDLSEITGRINFFLQKSYPHQHANCTMVDALDLPPFFPNPDFVPGLPSDELGVDTIRRMRQERQGHFDPRGRGVEDPAEPGSYFTGRTSALAALISWLSASDHDRRARVITGEPGSGKSALLGRLLQLADGTLDAEAMPHPLPPTGCITMHLHVRRRSLEEITADLTTALGLGTASIVRLLQTLAERDTFFTILIDALDEAGAAGDQTEPVRIAHDLLRPLSVIPGVRLIVGTRRGPIPALGAGVRIIDLDKDEYLGPSDIIDYSTALLLTSDDPSSPSPYRNDPVAGMLVARGIAARAGKSFLVARMAARAVIYGQVVVDVSQPGWQDRLPSESSEAFAAYLSRFGNNERRVRRLLAPLAYAEDEGLPWDRIWAPLATALSGEHCSDDDISWLLEHAGDYVVEAAVGDRSVFRLYHEALADYLRDSRRVVESHSRIAETLLDQVPMVPGGHGRDWKQAHSYTRTNLASHAAAANRIYDLLRDPEFLVYAVPSTLLSALREAAGKEDALTVSIYRSSLDRHRDAEPEVRRQMLALDAARYGEFALARTLSEPLPWVVRWATGSQTSPALQFSLSEQGSNGVRALACVVLDERMAVLTARRDGLVRVWDLATGEQRVTLTGHEGGVSSVACVRSGDRALAVTAGRDGTVRVWDIEQGQQLYVLTGHVGSVRAVTCTTLGDQALAISGGSDGTLRTWDLKSGAQRELLAGHTSWVNAVACTHIDRQAVVASASRDGSLRLWDLETGTQRAVLRGHSGGVYAVACTELDGRSVAVTGGDDRSVRVWDLEEERERSVLTGHTAWIRGAACTVVKGHATAVTVADDGTVRMWDLAEGTQRAVLTGHTTWVLTVDCTTLNGRPLAVTGSDDETVRVWDLVAGAEQTTRPGHAGEVKTVACASREGTRLAISGGTDRVVRVWDLETGTPRGILAGHTGGVNAVATLVLDGHATAVTGATDTSVRVWDLPASEQTAVLTGHVEWVEAVACTTVGDRPVAVSGADDRTVRLWDLANSEERAVLTGHTGGVNAIACTTLKGRSLAITGSSDGTIRIWDLEAAQQRAVLTGHTGWVRTVACATLHGRPVALSGGDDRTTRIWDLETCQQLAVLRGHSQAINAVTFFTMREWPMIATGSDDCTVRIWDAAGQRCHSVLALPYPVFTICHTQPLKLIVGAGWELVVYDPASDFVLGPQ